MSKNLTKYYYILNENYNERLNYQDLVRLKLRNVTATFSENKSDKVKYKGNIVERFRIT